MGAVGTGLSAVKLLPAVKLLGEYPRITAAGGDSWSQYKVLVAPSTTLDAAGTGKSPIAPQVSTKNAGVLPAEALGQTQAKARPSWRDLPAHLPKLFLGRDQQSDTLYFSMQGYGWQEYGAYLGPLAILLLAGSPLLLRNAWPWMVVAACCFLTAIGNFAPFAPWTLLHKLPVLSNMRVPSRFLIPCVFAACLLAGMVLDAIRRRLGTGPDGPRRWVDLIAYLLVTTALIDSMIVGRGSLQGTFPIPPPRIAPGCLPSSRSRARWSTRRPRTCWLTIVSSMQMRSSCIPSGRRPGSSQAIAVSSSSYLTTANVQPRPAASSWKAGHPTRSASSLSPRCLDSSC